MQQNQRSRIFYHREEFYLVASAGTRTPVISITNPSPLLCVVLHFIAVCWLVVCSASFLTKSTKLHVSAVASLLVVHKFSLGYAITLLIVLLLQVKLRS